MYKCNDCGRVFDSPGWVQVHIIEDYYDKAACCPHCHSENYDEVEQCECCRDEFVSTSEVLPICQSCKEQLENDMAVFEKSTNLDHRTFCEWVSDWEERNW